MYTDGQVHTLDYFQDVYTEVEVTADKYTEERSKGLYYNTGDLLLPEGVEEVIFDYKSPEGVLIQSNNIFVIADGEKGENGERGAHYFSTTKPAQPVIGDFYLDTTNLKLAEYTGLQPPYDWRFLDYTDDRYNQAIADMISHVENGGEQSLQVINAWVKNLVAGTILANKIFTRELVLRNDPDTGSIGEIKSADYKPGVKGFCLNTNGHIEAMDATIRGEIEATSGTFTGGIQANSLNITGLKPGDISFYRYNDKQITGEEAQIVVNYPIYGNGSINMLFTHEFSGSMAVQVRTYNADMEIVNDYHDVFNNRGQKTYRLDVTEGTPISVTIYPYGQQGYFHFNLLTDKPNAILGVLGDIKLSTMK